MVLWPQLGGVGHFVVGTTQKYHIFFMWPLTDLHLLIDNEMLPSHWLTWSLCRRQVRASEHTQGKHGQTAHQASADISINYWLMQGNKD